MKIFIDFDGVIFNSKDFKKRLAGLFSGAGVSAERFRKSYQEFKGRGEPYSPLKQIDFLAKKDEVDLQKMKAGLGKLMNDLKPFIFKEAENFLKSIPGNRLYLVSFGDLEFQKQKIKRAGMSRYFKRVIITKGSKSKAIRETARKDGFKKSEKIIFIDDNPKNIKEIEQDNIISIQFGPVSLQTPGIADFKVKDFKELKNLLKQLEKE